MVKLNAAQIRMLEFTRDHGNPLHGDIYVKQSTWQKTKRLGLFAFSAVENRWLLTEAGKAALST